MSLPRLSAMLFALAIMVAPLAMPGSRAAAAPMAPNHGHSATTGHCSATSGPAKPDRPIDHDCCAAMCLGIAVAAASPGEPPAYDPLGPRPSSDRFRRGFLGEIATPPPRSA